MNSQHYYSNTPVYTSRRVEHNSNTPVYTSRRVEQVAVGRREFLMSYGDRMCVRVSIGPAERMEYETSSVADLTDLMGDLRRRAKGKRGLAVVTIRNRDRGWVRERRVMLYPERTYSPAQKVSAVRPRMTMPWEV